MTTNISQQSYCKTATYKVSFIAHLANFVLFDRDFYKAARALAPTGSGAKPSVLYTHGCTTPRKFSIKHAACLFVRPCKVPSVCRGHLPEVSARSLDNDRF